MRCSPMCFPPDIMIGFCKQHAMNDLLLARVCITSDSTLANFTEAHITPLLQRSSHTQPFSRATRRDG